MKIKNHVVDVALWCIALSAGGFDSLEKEITPNQMKNQILVNEICRSSRDEW
jgi:hypothetical protein